MIVNESLFPSHALASKTVAFVIFNVQVLCFEYVYLSVVTVAGIFARGLVFFYFLQNGAQISLPVKHTRKKDNLVTFTTITNNLVMK
jgi:hypothetical protein